ncbi:MAG: YceI family protein [Saprospiraceae bacterium]|nr:YceI family protein [Saprospiraceae bacterium]
MMKGKMQFFFVAIAMFLLTAVSADAQKYFTRDGEISFFSDAPLEKIEAVNKKVASVLDGETGAIEFAVLIKSFHFEKALMEEHFNENYLESGKYPKATFTGTIDNISAIDLNTDGEYTAQVSGDMTIHGVTKPVSTTGKLIVSNGTIKATSTFEIAVADYEIKIPKVVKDNIAEIVEIRVAIDYKRLEQ